MGWSPCTSKHDNQAYAADRRVKTETALLKVAFLLSMQNHEQADRQADRQTDR